MKLNSKTLAVILGAALMAGCASGQHMKVKGNPSKFQKGKRVAIVMFLGNTVITGEGNAAALAARAAAQKGTTGSWGIDQDFIDKSYDLYESALKGEGYEVLPVAEVLASQAYQNASTFKLPSMKEAKNLRAVNLSKKEAAQTIAQELKVDYLVAINNGHGLFNKTGFIPFIGNKLGKNLGQATADVTVLNADGKRILWVNASEVSDKGAVRIVGLQDAQTVMPMFEDANRKLAGQIAAKIAKKG